MTGFKMVQQMKSKGYIKNLKHFKLRAECFQDVLDLITEMSKNLYGCKCKTRKEEQK
jgi:predicted site-specific integrase-resolvase